MRNIQILVYLLCLTASAYAQPTVAQDWVKTDCDGNTHQLYSYLDSNEVAVMMFIMGCSSCSDAAVELEAMKQSFDVSDPGKAHFFALDYWPGNTCAANVSPFITGFGLSYPGFEHCGPEKDYYTSASPMPMIVVAGGYLHQIYYFSLSYTNADSLTVYNAIDSAITAMETLGSPEYMAQDGMRLYPNPAYGQTTLDLSLPVRSRVEVDLLDLTGRRTLRLFDQELNGGRHELGFNTEGLDAGLYFMQVRTAESTAQRRLKLMIR